MFNTFWEHLRKGISAFFRNRVLVLGVILAPLAVVLVVRLFTLQIVRGSEYYQDYVNTTKKEVKISAMRGNIYDRNGTLLAGNRVVYNVTISDENYYKKADGSFNEMLLRLIRLLEKYGVEIRGTLPVAVSEEGEFVYDGSEARIRRFIKDVYGQTKIDDLKKQGVDAYAYDCETVMSYLMRAYYNFTTKWARSGEIGKEDRLKICNIRYALSSTAFTRYITTPVASDVSETVRAAVLESQADLAGVMVEEAYERVYYNSECFSSILGYVGSITTEEILELNAQGGEYIGGDIIGKEGIESYYESDLQGRKGRKTIYCNNIGVILYEEIIEEPVQGHDIYLSIDADTTIAAYNVVEQQLAGIIVKHLYNGTDYDPQVAYENSDYKTPIRDVYFQMINNNILSMKAFASEEAGDAEREMERKRIARKEEVIALIRNYLARKSGVRMDQLDTYMQAYIRYLYSALLSDQYLLSSEIDQKSGVYKDFKEGAISFPTFLLHALKSGWADMSRLGDESRYNSVETCYEALTEILLKKISEDHGAFDKLIYDELIHTDEVGGCLVARALIRQGKLKAGENGYPELMNGDNDTAFSFFLERIRAMELTPSQIALDPCSAGLVLTDPNTGELLACVSYPGYDSNRINESAYYSMLLNDQSSPLYSRATQSCLAPGSTFKMVTLTAALQGGFLGQHEVIRCEGIYDKLDHPRCWIYRLSNGEHGYVDGVHALGQSCNIFFYDCGFRFSTNASGQYSPTQGVNVLNEYARMYGFGTLTGVEAAENVSILTDELPVTSAIGQGTYAFTTISLARYVTAIASSGNVYEFRFLNRITDGAGNVIRTYEPVVVNRLNFPNSTWDILHKGMYTVVHEGGSRNGDFKDLRYDYAAKSGSAQENRLRCEHGWYVTYGPYEDISYAMAIQIPNGYSAGNAALVANDLYEYLEGDISLEEILNNSASSGSVNDIGD